MVVVVVEVEVLEVLVEFTVVVLEAVELVREVVVEAEVVVVDEPTAWLQPSKRHKTLAIIMNITALIEFSGKFALPQIRNYRQLF